MRYTCTCTPADDDRLFLYPLVRFSVVHTTTDQAFLLPTCLAGIITFDFLSPSRHTTRPDQPYPKAVTRLDSDRTRVLSTWKHHYQTARCTTIRSIAHNGYQARIISFIRRRQIALCHRCRRRSGTHGLQVRTASKSIHAVGSGLVVRYHGRSVRSLNHNVHHLGRRPERHNSLGLGVDQLDLSEYCS